MSLRNVFMIQHFERRGKDLVEGRKLAYGAVDGAKARAAQDVGLVAGVVVYEVVIETDTGEEVGEPTVLAELGEVAPRFASSGSTFQG